MKEIKAKLLPVMHARCVETIAIPTVPQTSAVLFSLEEAAEQR